MTYQELFGGRKPVMAMLHLKSDDRMSMMERAICEAECYLACGVEALVVENYFGSAGDCEQVLAWLKEHHPEAIYGVNILGDYPCAFELAEKYDAKFIQIDSVCGHLPPARDEKYAKELQEYRSRSRALVFGGVRFKYQPVRSGRSLEVDLWLGRERCDAIVMTGEGTGKATPMEKVDEFRQILGDFPLLVGAGVTIDTVGETFERADGAIVGSWFKTGHRDMGEVDFQTIISFLNKKRWMQSYSLLPLHEKERMYRAVMQSLEEEKDSSYKGYHLASLSGENSPAPWKEYLKNMACSPGELGHALASLLFCLEFNPGAHGWGRDLFPVSHAGWEETPQGPYYEGLALCVNGKCFAGREAVLYYADEDSSMETYERYWDLADVEAKSKGIYDLRAVKLPEGSEGAPIRNGKRVDAVLAFRLKPGYDECILVTDRAGEFDCSAGEVLDGDFSRLCPLYLDDFVMK